MNLRRVLIVADESADWIIAGLRQLDRLALAIDEFAVQNGETSPVVVCILWRADLDQCQRWIPADPRLTHVAFRNDQEAEPYDLVLSTRLFLYRKAVRALISEGCASARPTFSEEALSEVRDAQKRVPPKEDALWEKHRYVVESHPGAWEYIANGDQIDEVERRFLRGSGKSQDGFVSRYLNRPISREVTRLLLRFSATPNAWTWLIFPIPVVAALVIAGGTYWSFVWGLILYQVFSILDGCDGEIARAKFMESERGRQLDDLFDVLSNVLLALGLGFGLARAHPRFGWLFLAQGIAAGVLIAISEWLLVRAPATESSALGETLYPRHRALVERSGLLAFGENFAALLIQFTKRDVAVLFFVLLALVALPSLILHLLFVVAAVSLVLALRAR
ncbi:MAG TPA: CDP-alcohol phosphatidyltransferase family protein [Chthoniobacterales bacterium]|nr:CDP-alcohol phosphatidyltransferase family protein [Chthoniobacterales bacterium]